MMQGICMDTLTGNKMRTLEVSKVFIVDDHELVRQGLRLLIDGEVDLQVCGEAASVHDAMNMKASLHPDVAIIDISLPDGSGLDLIKNLHSWQPKMRIIALSMHDDVLYADRALNNGASGYINKQDSAQKLLVGIRQVINNKIFVSPEIAQQLQANQSNNMLNEKHNIILKLSNRQLQIFDFIGSGMSTNEIADKLKLSVKTIETHRRHIKDKLSLRSGAELVRVATIWAVEKQ